MKKFLLYFIMLLSSNILIKSSQFEDLDGLNRPGSELARKARTRKTLRALKKE